MRQLQPLTEKDLAEPQIYEEIKEAAFELVDHLMAPEARQIANELERKIGPALQSEAPDLYRKYRQIVICLKFVGLITLDKETFLKLIQFNLLEALYNRIDINERMTGRMYILPAGAWLDETEQALKVLKQNNQWLGSQKIVLQGDSETSVPSIKNWLTDYDRTFGPEKHSALERQQYLAQNPNVRLLSPLEKNALQMLLRFYDNLKPIPIQTLNEYFAAAGISDADFIAAGQGETSPDRSKTTAGYSEEKPTVSRSVFEAAPTSLSSAPPAATSPFQPKESPPYQSTPTAPPPSAPPAPAAGPPPSNYQPPRYQPPARPDTYREPVAAEDLAGPAKPPAKLPQKPGPRIEGNIVDLKDLGGE